MWFFRRKLRLSHRLVAENSANSLVGRRYHCAVCQRIFHSAQSASERREYCPGKHVYTEVNLRPCAKDAIPSYLMQLDEIKATGRALRKAQEPLAYLHYEFITGMYGPLPVEYIPLYDVREARELAGAIALPSEEA